MDLRIRLRIPVVPEADDLIVASQAPAVRRVDEFVRRLESQREHFEVIADDGSRLVIFKRAAERGGDFHWHVVEATGD